MYLRVCTFVDQASDETVLVEGTVFVVGRANDCNLQVVHSTVSRHHCQMSEIGRFTTVRDLGSSNGTYLNGNLLRGEEVIRGGDQLSLGMVLLEVLDMPALPRDEAAPIEEREDVLDTIESGVSDSHVLSLV